MITVYFASAGFGHIICANKVMACLMPGGKMARSVLQKAKKEQRYISMTNGKSIRSIILMDDGTVFGSHISTATMRLRLSGITYKGTKVLSDEETDAQAARVKRFGAEPTDPEEEKERGIRIELGLKVPPEFDDEDEDEEDYEGEEVEEEEEDEDESD